MTMLSTPVPRAHAGAARDKASLTMHALVRVDATTICGSNLRILKGELPADTGALIVVITPNLARQPTT